MHWSRCLALVLGLCTTACAGDKSDKPAPAQQAPDPIAVAVTDQAPDRVPDQKPSIDPRTGLVMAAGFDLVAATCATCHSGKLVAQNRGTRRDWDERLRWMQAKHNLWELPADTRAQILDYLATNYGIDDDAARHGRRRPLPEHLMPPTRAQRAVESEP